MLRWWLVVRPVCPQTLIGGGVSASGDDAASIRAARRQAQKSLEPAVLASELLQGLEVSAIGNSAQHCVVIAAWALRARFA